MSLIDNAKHMLVSGIAAAVLAENTPLPGLPYIGAGAVVTAGQVASSYLLSQGAGYGQGGFQDLEEIADLVVYNSLAAPFLASVLPLSRIRSTVNGFIPIATVANGVTFGVLTFGSDYMRTMLAHSGVHILGQIASPVSSLKAMLW